MQIILSLAQMNIRPADPEANLQQAREWIQEASARQSQLILFPELWHSGYDLAHAAQYAALAPVLYAQLAQLASQYHLWIGGSFIQKFEDQFANTFCLFSPEGGPPATYQKLHLFRLMEEEVWLCQGKKPTVAAAPWGPAGLAVCYDLRFPELFRHYALSGAQLILISAEWSLRRIQHWQTLLRARAIENLLYVVACNAVGLSGSDTFGGCSAVISPWGDPLVEGSTASPELLTTALDLDKVKEARQRIPIFEDRRTDLYGASGWSED